MIKDIVYNSKFSINIDNISKLDSAIILAIVNQNIAFYIINNDNTWYAHKYINIESYSYASGNLKDLFNKLVERENVTNFKYIEL